jgi:hypothetical protein
MPKAPKICSEIPCTKLVYDGGRKCKDHRKAWSNKGFDRRRADTAAHRKLKSDVLKRARYRCEIRYPTICLIVATEVDRIDNQKDYSLGNCQGGCTPCHRRKTSIEGHQAQGHTGGGVGDGGHSVR